MFVGVFVPSVVLIGCWPQKGPGFVSSRAPRDRESESGGGIATAEVDGECRAGRTAGGDISQGDGIAAARGCDDECPGEMLYKTDRRHGLHHGGEQLAFPALA